MADYPEDFVRAVNDLIDNWEGGYVNDPHDRGGETKYGISKRSYPHEDIKNLTRDDAITIYYLDYWRAPCMDDCDPALRAKIFNMGVLMGPMTAKRLAVGCHTLDEYRKVCEKHFEAIVIRRPSCGRYLKGWRRRALA